MDISLKHALYKTVSLFRGYVAAATFNNSSGNPAITESTGGSNLQDINRYNIPSVRPYGFVSLPNTNTQQIIANLGVSTKSPVVLGHLDVFSGKPFTLSMGDSAIYSNDLAMLVSSQAVTYYYPGGVATAISGEDVNQILSDTITYMQNQMQDFMNTVVQIFNEHVHGDSGGPSPQLPAAPEFPEQLTLDLQAVQEGTTLITNSGTTPIGGG